MGQRGFYRSGDGVAHSNTFAGSDPAASLLSDGMATYTPGVSEHRTGDNSTHYYASDFLGTLRFLRDSAGNQSEDSRYDGFGISAYKQNAPTTPFGFIGAQGYHTDYQDSGLVLLGNRFYDIGTGRFLSQDPIGDGDNWYAYCDNDPLDYSDPTGLSTNGGSGSGSEGNTGLGDDNGTEETRTKTTYTDSLTGDSWVAYTPWVSSGSHGVGSSMGATFNLTGFRLPNHPSGLPPGWTHDPTHGTIKNGVRHGSERYISPDKKSALDFDKGRPENQSKKQQSNHWHRLKSNSEGEWERAANDHLTPGTEFDDGTAASAGSAAEDMGAAAELGAQAYQGIQGMEGGGGGGGMHSDVNFP